MITFFFFSSFSSFIVNCSSQHFLFSVQCYGPIHKSTSLVCENYFQNKPINLWFWFWFWFRADRKVCVCWPAPGRSWGTRWAGSPARPGWRARPAGWPGAGTAGTRSAGRAATPPRCPPPPPADPAPPSRPPATTPPWCGRRSAGHKVRHKVGQGWCLLQHSRIVGRVHSRIRRDLLCFITLYAILLAFQWHRSFVYWDYLAILPSNNTFHHHVQYSSCAILLLTTTSQYHCQLVLFTENLTYISP